MAASSFPFDEHPVVVGGPQKLEGFAANRNVNRSLRPALTQEQPRGLVHQAGNNNALLIVRSNKLTAAIGGELDHHDAIFTNTVPTGAQRKTHTSKSQPVQEVMPGHLEQAKVSLGQGQPSEETSKSSVWRCLNEAGTGQECKPSQGKHGWARHDIMFRHMLKRHGSERYAGNRKFVEVLEGLEATKRTNSEYHQEVLCLLLFHAMFPGRSIVYIRFKYADGRLNPDPLPILTDVFRTAVSSIAGQQTHGQLALAWSMAAAEPQTTATRAADTQTPVHSLPAFRNPHTAATSHMSPTLHGADEGATSSHVRREKRVLDDNIEELVSATDTGSKRYRIEDPQKQIQDTLNTLEKKITQSFEEKMATFDQKARQKIDDVFATVQQALVGHTFTSSYVNPAEAFREQTSQFEEGDTTLWDADFMDSITNSRDDDEKTIEGDNPKNPLDDFDVEASVSGLPSVVYSPPHATISERDEDLMKTPPLMFEPVPTSPPKTVF